MVMTGARGPGQHARTLRDRESAEHELPCLRLALDRDQAAPSIARAAVRGFSQESDFALAESATLALLVSELVSNAVLHSDAPSASAIVLRARLLDAETVRIEVVDAGTGFGSAPRDRVRPRAGYGLFLVDSQSTRWGIDREGGTRVWFELSRSVAGFG